MTSFLAAALANALTATVLALVVWLVSRFRAVPRPLVHGLWLLVLVKLLTPPIWDLPLGLNLPVLAALEATPVAAVEFADALPATPVLALRLPECTPTAVVKPSSPCALPEPLPWLEAESEAILLPGDPWPEESDLSLVDDLAPVPDGNDRPIAHQEPAPPIDLDSLAVFPALPPMLGSTPSIAALGASGLATPPWVPILAALWLAGTLTWLVMEFWPWRRLTVALQFTSPPPAHWEALVAELAAEAGLRSPPRVRLLPGSFSPCVVGLGRRAWLLLPEEPCQRLSLAEQRCLVLHELAHLRRGDNWVRLVETVARAVYWWHPLVPWFCSELRQAEEECCDAWVVSTRPRERQAYALVMVRMVEFLADAAISPPALGSGLGDFAHLKRRLEMLRNELATPRLGFVGRAVLVATAALLLPLGWSWAQDGPQEPPRRGGRPERPEPPGRPETPERPERPEPPDRPERPRRPEAPPMPPGAAVPPTAPSAMGLRAFEDQVFQAEMEVRRAETKLRIQRARLEVLELQVRAAANARQRARPEVTTESERSDLEIRAAMAGAELAVGKAELDEAEINVELAKRRLASVRTMARAGMSAFSPQMPPAAPAAPHAPGFGPGGPGPRDDRGGPEDRPGRGPGGPGGGGGFGRGGPG